jgi:hypothetical protein
MKQLEQFRKWLLDKPIRADSAAILTLTLLWAFYFWRVLTPNPVDQVSLPQGDYSGQFVSFGAYQARRLLAGEIPLWNPYNYAGLPFIADTQAAVFYPPRLVTIVISHLFFGGWSYAALQAETIAHYWLGALFMYLFVRTITQSRLAGIVSGIALAYGGYLTGYPPLQLAMLEAGIWLPVGLLGIYKASEANQAGWDYRWLALTALALGIGLSAGHPQTSLFTSYTLIAYSIHRAVKQHINWRPTAIIVIATLSLGFGLAAIQVLPGLEYTRLTVRADYGFDALAGGFPFSDLITLLLPNVLTVWSPLYLGIAVLALTVIAIWLKQESARLWGVWALIALGFSFGGATIIYRMAYLFGPGFSLFRGQERAAYLITHSVAILAGLGTAALLSGEKTPGTLRLGLGIAAGIGWLLAVEVFVIDRIVPPDERMFALLKASFFLALLLTLTWVVVGLLQESTHKVWWPLALTGLIVFDLFSVTMSTNWEPIPVGERKLLSDLVPVALEDQALFRVDGRLGLGENYGTLVGLQDIRGTSPLRPAALDRYLALPQYRLHQLLGVKYVFTDWEQIEVPSTVKAKVSDHVPPLFLHEINDPTSRAWMAYHVMITEDDNQALGWMADPTFDPRSTVVLASEPPLDLPAEAPEDWSVTVERYAPENIALTVNTPADGILVISEWDYPGWQAAVNGKKVDLWRVNAGLRGLPLQAGEYHIEMTYRPLSVTLGAIISTVSALLLVAAGSGLFNRIGKNA